ncbi:hypothetical protein BpHYR1_000759 [Brachionus plicatilis]|uniref:Uncharacterized protein n=1 Tax=Brachionus plicatilis TaxID=10195 RepID=A0A3M7RTL7_BRAPC|nr:hypothetical protein BpHYR1_000759 [Brachionus plicatilis]
MPFIREKGKLKFEIKIKRSKYKLEKINFFKSNSLTCHNLKCIKLESMDIKRIYIALFVYIVGVVKFRKNLSKI